MNSKNRNDYLEAIHASNPRWNRSVTLEEVIQRQRKLNQSLGIENAYLGMSFSNLKALGHGLRG